MLSQNMSHASILGWSLLLVAFSVGLYTLASFAIFASTFIIPFFGAQAVNTKTQPPYATESDSKWNAPNQTQINNLNAIINGFGVNGFIFNNSYAVPGNDYYGGYNWCNMPHVNPQTYVKAPPEFELKYVEVIHRHHKRTPYASNTFPRESTTWDCNDEGLFYSGKPLNPLGNDSASIYWSVYTSASNPFTAGGFNGTCQFPQITRGGLDDSYQHGKDLYAVYHDRLGFLPETLDDRIAYRVTNNVITSQVAGMVVNAMFNPGHDVPLQIQAASIDSLEPTYTCPAATSLYSAYGIGSNNEEWTAHLTASAQLFAYLDSISGIDPSSTAWHQSWDHYFDNLSSRMCHAKPLPCQISNLDNCINITIAEQVFRLGQYEYSHLYRDHPLSLRASTASYGVFIAEVAQNIRDAIHGGSKNQVLYRHKIAHDGSIARLLSILQVDVMVWPGMGAEVVFEVFSRRGDNGTNEGAYFVRILWGGVVLRSSHPALGLIDFIPVDKLLGYFDALVGVGAQKVPGLCTATEAS